MFSYSTFKHIWNKSKFPCDTPLLSQDYKVYVNGEEVPVYTCRISAYPLNRIWPDFQRPIEQTEVVSFVNLVSNEKVKIEVEPLTKLAYERIMIKPYSKEIKPEKIGNKVVFTLHKNGGYVLELDDYHGLLYIFNNKPVICENPKNVTYYFGKGVHFPGKITLKSNESIYLEKDAYVYGSIFAEDAENIHIYGNGVFDDSGEERFASRCYEFYTNGNVKFYDCKNVKIEGVGFVNSAIWCVNLFHCFDVEIDGINVFGQWRYNTDGVDIVNSQRILIKNSFIHSFDDAITVKGIDRYANTDCTDMLFENCVLWCDWGKTCEIGLETMCREYKNITFRDCDILRAGNTACDIQNGDCAEVYDITFENIRIELESFYTPEIYQSSEMKKYDAQDKTQNTLLLNIVNPRWRETDMYKSIGDGVDIGKKRGEKNYASVHDIKVKNLIVYADDKVYSEKGTKCAHLLVSNLIETTEFKNIAVENVVLNGKKLSSKDMDIVINGVESDVLDIK